VGHQVSDPVGAAVISPSVLRGGARALARGAVDVVAGTRFGSLQSVRTDEPLVALTFDDGPDSEWTRRILNILAVHQARATFFMVVHKARRLPDLVGRVIAEGHEVALHGMDHRSLAGLSRRYTRQLLTEAARELATISGTRVVYFRPPFGAQTVASFLGTRDAGLHPVVWDVDSLDWHGEDRQAADEVVSRVVPGSIALLHDGIADDIPRRGDRAKTLQLILNGLAQRSLRSTTVSRLQASGTPKRTAWFQYPRSQ
jgi:peptidoglycan/xylan/chitin deacetylase (PgdA/CDA1 family)